MTNALIIIFVTILFVICGYLLGVVLFMIFGDDKTGKTKENEYTEYIEKDTKCDRCKFLNECSATADVTLLSDTRPHYECFDSLNCKRRNGVM